MPSDWHVSKDRQQTGPFTSAELRAMVSSGHLGPDDFVWKEGMKDWVPAGKIKGLFATVPVTTESQRATIANEVLAGPSLSLTRLATVLGNWGKFSTPARTGIAAVCAGILLVASFAVLAATLQKRNRLDNGDAVRANDAKPAAPIVVFEPNVVVAATHETASKTILFIGLANDDFHSRPPNNHPYDVYLFDQATRYQDLPQEWLDEPGERPPWVRKLAAGTKLRALKVKNIGTNEFHPVQFVEVLTGPHKGTRGWIADNEILHN